MKKIIIYTFSLKLIVIIIFLKWYVLNTNNIENNVVMIVKNSEIVKNNENPRWIFSENNNNINKNISTWIFLDKNIVLTASHWVNTIDSKYIIYDNFWNSYNWKLINKDTQNDFATIQIETEFLKYKKININNNLKLWEEIFSIWYNNNIKSFETKKWFIKEFNNNKIVTDISFIKWNSWWPIYNKNKELIWIILEVDTKNNLWYFLKISDFLK